jgi:WD40 repeat protein
MSHAAASRTVRVFLSSTFRDFALERDLLVRRVFPELRRMCMARRVDLIDLDLRWGITEEEARQGRILPICLAEIDRSRPWFMGFIGERYGWVPAGDQYPDALLEKEPWLTEHRGGKSVTELEILHGVLNNPGMRGRAFFYLRDPAWSRRQGGVFLPEDANETARLEALKERIRGSGFPVVEGYSDPEALAMRVKEDLWRLIDEAFPEESVPDPLARERIPHEQYAASRRGLYLGGEAYLAALDAVMAGGTARPVLVTGESGGGKSALLANWAAKVSAERPGTPVVVHFLAVGAAAADPVEMVARLLREISRFTGRELILDGNPGRVFLMLGDWLAEAGRKAMEAGTVFVVVVDALDKLTSQRELQWWPRTIPPGVALVVSCLGGDVLEAARARMDWSEVRVLPMGPGERGAFVKGHFEKYGKKLLPEDQARILSHRLAGNPLFLRTLLEELRVFGVHEKLGVRLAQCLGSATVDDLFERVLERVESDHGAVPVRAVLGVLWAARESLPENELLEVAGVAPAVWAPVHVALEEALSGGGGRLAFSHDYLRKAVGDRYLAGEADRGRIQRRMAEFCAGAMEGGRGVVSDYVRRHAVGHFLEVGDWEGASAALSDLEFIGARAEEGELSLMLMDYAAAIRLLPEGGEERRVEAERQAALDRYALEMREYAAAWSRIRDGSGEAEPPLPVPVKSVRLWSVEEAGAERRRITESPDRLDVVKAFRVFVATNLRPLESCASVPGYVAHLGFHSAPGGVVHEAGRLLLERRAGIRFQRCFSALEQQEPADPRRMVLDGFPGGLAYCVDANSRRALAGGGMTDEPLIVWDLISGMVLRELGSSCPSVLAVAMSLDGSIGVSGGMQSYADESFPCECWDLASGSLLHSLKGHTGEILAVAVVPDGSLGVSAGVDGSIRIWDLAKGVCLRVLGGEQQAAHSVAVTADGRIVVSGGEEKMVRIWDSDTGCCIRVLEGHGFAVRAVAVSADSKFVASLDSEGILILWETVSGRCIRKMTRPLLRPRRRGYEDRCEVLSVSADFQIAVAGPYEKERLFIWDLRTGKLLGCLDGHGEAVKGVKISHDGREAVSAGQDGRLIAWDLQHKGPEGGVRFGRGALIRVQALAMVAEGARLVTGADDRTVRVWGTEDYRCDLVLVGHGSGVSGVAVSPDSRSVASASDDGTVRLWDLQGGSCVHVLAGHARAVATVTFSPGGNLVASGSYDRTVRIWDAATGVCFSVLVGHEARVDWVAFSPDGARVVSVDVHGMARIWEVGSWECTGCFKNDSGGLMAFSLSPDGRLLLMGNRLRRFPDGAAIASLEGHKDSVLSGVFTPDGQSVVSGSADRTARVWDVSSGLLLEVLQLDAPVSSVSVSSSHLACASGDGFRCYRHERLIRGPLLTTACGRSGSPSGVPVFIHPICCGQRIPVPSSSVERIGHWALQGGEGGYTDPALLMDCPGCGTPLRLNPFLISTGPGAG